MNKDSAQGKYLIRPPVVAVLGHVDHGKTTLLDYIRKSAITKKEYGGITQHIGAYQYEIKTKGKNSKKSGKVITFIDTPGHEAFSKMRSRGARVADIAVLVVAANDSVKPQTVESIKKIQNANIPMIVALNKVDLPDINKEKVRQDLAKAGVQVEGFGGDIPLVEISATKGTGVQKLLEMIVLVAELQELESKPNSPMQAVVIETQVDKGKGKIATVIVKTGTVTPRQSLYEKDVLVGKVRAMFDEHGKSIKTAKPGKPVEILGFISLPVVGSVITEKKMVIEKSSAVNNEDNRTQGIPDFLKAVEEQEKKKLNILLKADTAGSLEAIKSSLSEKIKIIRSGIGDISESDILDAKAGNAFVIGFNVKATKKIEKLAQVEKVVYRTYTIIYKLLEELDEVSANIREVITAERELGSATIIAEFPYNDQTIAGCKVSSGRLARGDTVKLMRNDDEVKRAKIQSLRQKKESVDKVAEGKECGVLFDNEVDFQLQDVIIPIT